jgi:hypothetical protein
MIDSVLLGMVKKTLDEKIKFDVIIIIFLER